jgi:type II secretory pathway component PulC
MSKREVFLLFIFVLLGFSCAFLFFKFFTKPKPQVRLSDLSVEEIIARTKDEKVKPVVQQSVEEPTVEEPLKESESEKLVNFPKYLLEEESASEVTEEVVSEKREIPSLILNGVFASESSSYALINNQVVREGDTISGVKVLRIYSNRVDLDAFGEKITLRIQ